MAIETAQLIYVCDHVVDNNANIFDETIVVRDAINDYDIVCPGFIIGNIYSVHSVNDGVYTFYYENIHFEKFTSDKIRWLTSIKPPSNTQYSIEYIKIDRNITKYNQEDCTRCNGNGWYVDLTNKNGSTIGIISGSDKIMQDFVKILLTKSVDGTPDLFDFISGNNYDNTPEQIAEFIKRCEYLYKQKQADMISNGQELDDSEILNKVFLSELEFDTDLGAYFISISLIVNNGQTIDVGLKV